MPIMKCICGYQMDAADSGELYAELRAHSDEEHAELNIGDDEIREVIAAQARMTQWEGAAIALTAPVEITTLDRNSTDDFVGFFDTDAFMDNPMWASCYCLFPHVALSQDEWNARTGEQNRADKTALIRSGVALGYLTKSAGRVVGWCHAAPRATLPGIVIPFAAEGDPDGIGAIACFVVSAPYRRQGIARTLLAAACDGFRAQGLTYAEAYPAKEPASDALAHRGPLDMYLAAGFTTVRETQHAAIVRKPLDG